MANERTWLRALGLGVALVSLDGSAIAPALAESPIAAKFDDCMVCEYPSQDSPVPGYHSDWPAIINTHLGGQIHWAPVWGQCGLFHGVYFF